MKRQLKYFKKDLDRMFGKNKKRILIVWLSRSFWGIFLYRIERSFFLIIGKKYAFVRLVFLPVINLVQAFSNIDLHYRADIKGGLSILHPSTGVVISGYSCIGKNFTVTGGNVIGKGSGSKRGITTIGDNCFLGANAVILGPITLGNNLKIGALACVTKDCVENNITLVGVPATPKKIMSYGRA